MLLRNTLIATALVALAAPAFAQSAQPSPMDSAQSHAVRKAYAACREKPTEMSRFLCECYIVDAQCDAALDPSHGMWRTVEMWPSDDPADRAVYFYLGVSFDQAYALDAFDQGIIQSCTSGRAEMTIHLGDVVDVMQPVRARIDTADIAVSLVEQDNAVVAVIDNPEAARAAFADAQDLTVTFSDEWGDPVDLDFTIEGYANVTRGWEPLCDARTS